MAAVTICSDFGAPQNKVCHCFHWLFPYYSYKDIHTHSHAHLSPKASIIFNEVLLLGISLRSRREKDDHDFYYNLPYTGAGGEGDARGWDGWMASPTRWTWVWVNSTSWWWTGRPGGLRFMGSQWVGHDWSTELSWTEPYTGSILGKTNQKHKTWKRRKITFTCIWYDSFPRKPWKTKTTFNKFSKLTGYSMNAQKSVSSIYTNNNHSEETKKADGIQKHSLLLNRTSTYHKDVRYSLN